MSEPKNNQLTERLLIDAGIVPGMRVIDFGCGGGDVTFLVAKLVGAKGAVLGIDRDATALALARQAAHEANLLHVTFRQSDLQEDLTDIGQYDAIVGRRVLMYLPNPVDTIRRLCCALRPGGVVVFQEHDATMVPGRTVPLQMHERVLVWIWETVKREGANTHIGFELPALLDQAGLTVEQVRAEAVILGQNTHHSLAFIMRAMLPRMLKQSVVSTTEVDLDTLDQRLSEERASLKSVYITDMVFSAWARKSMID